MLIQITRTLSQVAVNAWSIRASLGRTISNSAAGDVRILVGSRRELAFSGHWMRGLESTCSKLSTVFSLLPGWAHALSKYLLPIVVLIMTLVSVVLFSTYLIPTTWPDWGSLQFHFYFKDFSFKIFISLLQIVSRARVNSIWLQALSLTHRRWTIRAQLTGGVIAWLGLSPLILQIVLRLLVLILGVIADDLAVVLFPKRSSHRFESLTLTSKDFFEFA